MAAETTKVRVGVRVPVTSLCPCSREISDYGAHNQRGHVEIDVACQPGEQIWFEDLIDVAEAAASAPIYSLLKRVDERHVTMTAYENPPSSRTSLATSSLPSGGSARPRVRGARHQPGEHPQPQRRRDHPRKAAA